jgi:hypothetical protein
MDRIVIVILTVIVMVSLMPPSQARLLRDSPEERKM